MFESLGIEYHSEIISSSLFIYFIGAGGVAKVFFNQICSMNECCSLSVYRIRILPKNFIQIWLSCQIFFFDDAFNYKSRLLWHEGCREDQLRIISNIQVFLNFVIMRCRRSSSASPTHLQSNLNKLSDSIKSGLNWCQRRKYFTTWTNGRNENADSEVIEKSSNLLMQMNLMRKHSTQLLFIYRFQRVPFIVKLLIREIKEWKAFVL